MAKNGTTLIEIMMAMGFLLVVFVPLMVGLGSSMKGTNKADRTTKAVNIACEKMNIALAFPFGDLEPSGQQVSYGTSSKQTVEKSGLALDLGPEVIDGFQIRSTLKVSYSNGSFEVPIYDPEAKLSHRNNPGEWNWQIQRVSYNRRFARYELSVFWRDKTPPQSQGGTQNSSQGDSQEKHYTLVSYKADIRGTADEL